MEAMLRSFEDMSVKEIAEEIEHRLKLISEDPARNMGFRRPKVDPIKTSVIVYYDPFDRGTKLNRAEAEHYLGWLRKNNAGNHIYAGIYHH